MNHNPKTAQMELNRMYTEEKLLIGTPNFEDKVDELEAIIDRPPEQTTQTLIQTSPIHSVLFITRFTTGDTVYQAYLIEVPQGRPPEPMVPITMLETFTSIHSSMEGNEYNREEFKSLSRRCIEYIKSKG